MSDDVKQRDIYREEAERNYSGLSLACASQVNEYGFSYYWWYYSIPTSNCHELGKSI
jgi:hypothetical protein